MSNVRFIADLHKGHKNMALHRGFSSVEEHDKYIIDKWNSVVNKKDTTYILGDITMEKKDYNFLDELNGNKFIISGNHDRLQHSKELMNHVNGITGMFKYKDFILSHAPIHPMELKYFKYNIHGHIHEKEVKKFFGLMKDKRYFCVSCEHLDFTPITYNEILERL